MIDLASTFYWFDRLGHVRIHTWASTYLHPVFGHVVHKQALAAIFLRMFYA